MSPSDPSGADLLVPSRARGLVIVTLTRSGGPDDHALKDHLQLRAIASLSVELLTPEEALPDGVDGHVPLDTLADRVAHAVSWAHAQQHLRHLAVGLFGDRLAGAVALAVASRRPHAVAAVVAVDSPLGLVGRDLNRVGAPTLLVTSADLPLDSTVARAARLLPPGSQLEVAPPTSAPAARRDRVAELATSWFVGNLAPAEHIWSEEGAWSS